VQANVVAGFFYVVVTQYSTDTSLCTGGRDRWLAEPVERREPLLR
jgi:hypothetical protein